MPPKPRQLIVTKRYTPTKTIQKCASFLRLPKRAPLMWLLLRLLLLHYTEWGLLISLAATILLVAVVAVGRDILSESCSRDRVDLDTTLRLL